VSEVLAKLNEIVPHYATAVLIAGLVLQPISKREAPPVRTGLQQPNNQRADRQ
jgi:hypothetical protein